MKKDQQSLLRMNFLYQAAKLYQNQQNPLIDSPISAHFLRQLVQVSQKKIIRIDKQVKKKFCKKCYRFKKYKINKNKKNEAIVQSVKKVQSNKSHMSLRSQSKKSQS